jgi:iron complex outermembrane recepter protein
MSETYWPQQRTLWLLLMGCWMLPALAGNQASVAVDIDVEDEALGVSAEQGLPSEPLPDPIIVTARKREEPLAEVPASILVIDEAQVVNGRLTTLGDLDRFAPNLQLSDANGVRTLYLRGVGGGGRQVGFDPRSGIFVDGVQMNQPPSVNSLLLDVQRVEVLRGPQSTLFGADAESGALSLVTRAPGETASLDAQTVIGSDGNRQLRIGGDLPLSNTVLTRTSAYVAHHDGFVKNLEDGRQLDRARDAGGRLRLRWLADENLTVDLSADQGRQQSENPLGEARTSPLGDGPPASPSPYTSNLNSRQRDVNENDGLSAAVHYLGDGWTLRAITARRTAERHWIADFDHSARDFLSLDYRDRYRSLSQEVRALFDGDRDSAVLGLFVLDQRAQSDRVLVTGSEIDEISTTLQEGD